MLYLRFTIQLLFAGVFYAALVIGPAWLITGSIDWSRGWLAIGTLWTTQLAGGLWFVKNDPDLMQERMSPADNASTDKIATTLIALLMLSWLVGNPIDVHYLHLLPPPPPQLSLITGLGLFSVGMFLIIWTLRTNTFAVSVVKVQQQRNQQVIDSGPYAFVRHPMYSGIMPVLAGLSLIMESTAMAIVVWPMVMLGFLPRILTEEATLRRDLPGYEAYAARVRWRLIPAIC